MGAVGNIIYGGAVVELPDGVDLGYIKDGLHIAKEEEVYYARAEGVPTPVAAYRTSLQYSMSGTLIEPTLLNIQKVYAVSGTAASPLEMGLAAEMDIANATANTSGICNLLFTSVVPSTTFLREIEATKAVADGPGELVFTDAEEVSLPFVFKVIWDGTHSLIITDAAV
jgi:hypothetical protein